MIVKRTHCIRFHSCLLLRTPIVVFARGVCYFVRLSWCLLPRTPIVCLLGLQTDGQHIPFLPAYGDSASARQVAYHRYRARTCTRSPHQNVSSSIPALTTLGLTSRSNSSVNSSSCLPTPAVSSRSCTMRWDASFAALC